MVPMTMPGGSRRSARCSIRAALLALIAALRFAAPSSAGTPTGSWDGDFAIPAFDGDVSACAILDQTYFVGGDFQWAGDVPARNVAMWTGSAWTQVGLGLPARVRKLAVWGTDLLAGTDFDASINAPLMRFDGLSWQPLGGGTYGQVDAILVDGPYVYIAGQLYQVGNSNGYRVMRWDGSTWEPLGGLFDNRVRALAIYRGELYAAGEFLNAEGVYVSRIARWDGTHWQAVGGGTGAGGGVYVGALAVYGDRLIAGGGFPSMGGVTANGIAAWDGSVWQALPGTPVDVVIQDLQVEGSLLHVAGLLQVPNDYAAGLVTFDGSTWRPPSTYPDWGVVDVAIGDGRLIAVGSYAGLVDRASSFLNPARDVVVRDPAWHTLTAWQPTMRGLLGPGYTVVEALHNHRGELYAGGYFEYAADPPSWTGTFGLARWDGAGWKSVSAAGVGWVDEMTSWGDRLVIGGSGFWANGVSSAVLGWDGNAWSNLGGSIDGWVGGLAEWQGALVACGNLRPSPGSVDRFGVLINRGSGWAPLGSLDLGGETRLTDLTSFGGDLYLAGYVGIPGTGWKGLARWNGSIWVAVPATPLNVSNCLLARQDGLWVGGTVSGLGPEGAVWRWDGQAWTSIGDLVGTVAKLVEVDGMVMACGAFSPAGGPATVVVWDGEQWRGVAGSPDKMVMTMASVGRDLWIGGWFTRAGGRQAEAVARWRRDLVVTPVALAMAQPWPSPARDRVAFRFSLPADGHVELRIYDLRGALVARPIDERLPAGTYEREWSIAAATERIRPGIYFARLVTPKQTVGARIVIGALSR